jgi:LEA14-like dessication related protein
MNDGVWIGLGIVGLWLYSKAHTGTSLQFVPLGASWSGGALQVDIGVQNPTNDTLQLNSLAGSVFVNGTIIGNVSDFTPRLITANQQTAIQLTYTPNLLGTAAAILNQVNNGGGIQIAINGAANVNGISLPINLTFQAIAA